MTPRSCFYLTPPTTGDFVLAAEELNGVVAALVDSAWLRYRPLGMIRS